METATGRTRAQTQADLTPQQQRSLQVESVQAGLSLAHTMGGYGAFVGLAIGGMKAFDAKPPNSIYIGGGAAAGLIIGVVGGYFAGAARSKSFYLANPEQIPVLRVDLQEEFVGPPNPEW